MPTVLVLVDGEHYPPVIRWGLAVARERGYEPVAALLVGGGEKLADGGALDLGAVALVRGVPYVGADFRLDPPPAAGPLPVPAFAVIGTGKRTGKTAIGGTAA